MSKCTTFLLVDDDSHDAFFVKQEIEGALNHVRVLHVGDGLEAVRYLKGEGGFAKRQEHPLPDVILLDLKMPGLDGFDFLEWLRHICSSELRLIPVVVMSDSALQGDVRRAYALGANLFMCKPVDWDVFRERIRMLGIILVTHVEIPEIPPLQQPGCPEQQSGLG